MVWEKIKEAITGRKSSKGKEFAKGAAGAAAVAGLVAAAKKMHERGYDEKAVRMLKDSSEKLKKEAKKLEKKAKREIKKRKKPEDINAMKKKAKRMTKADLKSFAAKEYDIRLSTNDLKKEMVDKFVKELKKR